MIVLLTLLVLITNANGCIRSKDAIHSSAVRITCPEDITKIAHRRTTSATVTWKRKDFRIESTHPIKAVFQTVPIHGASATVTKTFPEGVHRIQYKAVDEAGIIGSCSFSISVSVVRCDRLFNPNPHVGRLICDAGNVYGSMCTLSCYQGYKVVGSQTIYCTAEGHWSGDVPFCQITTCPDPGTPIHGTRFCTTVNHAYGSFCTFTCRHGHQLIGKDKLFCTSDSGKTHWSAETPVCEPIQPPRVEVCPPDHVITTSDVPKTIQKPRILFRTASGDEAPYTCSHFGENNKHNFTLGVHVVTCTAFDPTFGDKATAVCRFTVHVKANPCRPLNQPQNGVLLCSRAQGGGTVRHETSCRLHCDKGFTLGRDAGDDRDTFVCDSSGNWLPSSVVSSCVKPIRPQEIKLPAEILYNTSDCSNSSYLRTIEIKFQAAVQAALRVSETGVCATNPGDCIVDEVNSHCRDVGDVSYDRYRRHLAVSSDRRRHDAAGVRYGGQAPDRHSDRRSATHYVLPVLFHFGTRVPETSGDWPDEYHNALRRLYGMFDTFETQVLAGSFSITHKVRDFYVEELRNSLAYHTEIAICDIGYEFKSSIKLCVPCGAGTYYDIDLEQCVLCSAGFYQNHWAQFSCKPCPPGSATIQRGATSQSQCVDIDECLSNPCQHNGRCIDGVSSYTCKCRAGFGGRNCENVVYDCSKHACQSGGLCIPTGPSTYTCQCKPNYFGEFCQIHIVDGGWSEWSEWATCSKSCDGGVTSRFRSCDNPSPNDKGKPCRGPSSEEKTCNRHSCPVCKRLRRPYQGNIQCRRIAEDDGFQCVVSCPKGYTFSAPVFPVYVCGRSTAYRWPHETPDNPRCTVPACTRLRAPDNMMYRFLLVAGMQCPPVNTSHQLSPLIAEQARHLTNHLSCIRANTCTLSQPHVACCGPANRTEQSPDPLDCLQAGSRTKRELANSDLTRPNGRGSNEAASRNRGVDVDDEFVAIDVVLNYRGRLDKERLDVAELGEKLMNATKSGQLHFVYNGHVIVPDKNQTKMITDVICPPGTIISSTGIDCVECSPGSYYKTNPPVCIPCDVGYYQPEAGQSSCRRCPDNQITFGRGAIVPEECYDKGTKPPNVSEDVYYRLEFEMSRSPLYHVIPISIISCLIILTTAAIISVSTHVRSLICQGRIKDDKP